MRNRWLTVGVAAIFWVGCAGDSMEGSRATGDGDGLNGSGSGSGGSGGGDGDFGNTSWQPPAVPVNVSVTGGSCTPGHYEGSFEGMYMPSLTFNFPLPIAAAEVNGEPGLQFDLVKPEGEVECDPGDEFCFDYRIEAGVIQGYADPGMSGLPVPFSVDLNGDLDCDKGTFVGTLDNGMYTVFGALPYSFGGTITASYDAANKAFFDGQWAVTEPDFPGSGGDGMWDAIEVGP